MKYDGIARPLVFICSPLAGNIIANTQNARMYCRFAVKKGAIPFAPHLLYPQFMDDNDSAARELGIAFGIVMLKKCDGLWAFGDKASKGMKLEIAKAKELGLMIKYFDFKCVEVSPFA